MNENSLSLADLLARKTGKRSEPTKVRITPSSPAPLASSLLCLSAVLSICPISPSVLRCRSHLQKDHEGPIASMVMPTELLPIALTCALQPGNLPSGGAQRVAAEDALGECSGTVGLSTLLELLSSSLWRLGEVGGSEPHPCPRP